MNSNKSQVKQNQFQIVKVQNMVPDPGLEPHQCLFASMWMKNCSDAMLATKSSAGVAPEVDIREHMYITYASAKCK